MKETINVIIVIGLVLVVVCLSSLFGYHLGLRDAKPPRGFLHNYAKTITKSAYSTGCVVGTLNAAQLISDPSDLDQGFISYYCDRQADNFIKQTIGF